MHPILARFERLAAYLALWCAIGVLVGGVLTSQGLTWPEALVQVLPPLLVYSFICLSAWYVCRAMPLATSGVPGVLTASVVAASVGGALWLALNEAWIATLESMPVLAPVTVRFRSQTPFLFAVSVMLFLLVLSVHYVVLAFEAFRDAERHQLELKVLTRDAELRALRAQVDPHFLYNSLNSISALTGSDPAAARRMCLLLADFLRTTLRVSTQDSITMADELMLADRFLSIEQVRFGSRLNVERHIDETASLCRIPPLVLQPLLENAVAHGIAGLIDGGTIRLDVSRRNDRLSIAVANPRDPDAMPRKAGGGVGLDNVRRRLALVFGGAARMDAIADPDGFRVAIDLPCAGDE
jgi:two-component system sensor histidine kinase AlgZ